MSQAIPNTISTLIEKSIDDIAKNKDINGFRSTFDSLEYNITNNNNVSSRIVEHAKYMVILFRLILNNVIVVDKGQHDLYKSRIIATAYKISKYSDNEIKLVAINMLISVYSNKDITPECADIILDHAKDAERLSAISPHYVHNIYYYVARAYFAKKNWVNVNKFCRLHIKNYYKHTKNILIEVDKSSINIFTMLCIALLHQPFKLRSEAYSCLNFLINSMNANETRDTLMYNLKCIFEPTRGKDFLSIDVELVKRLLNLFNKITDDKVNKDLLFNLITLAVLAITDNIEFKTCFDLINEGFGNISIFGTVSFFGRTGDKNATLDYVDKIVGHDNMKALIRHLVDNNYEPIYRHIKLENKCIYVQEKQFIIAMILQNQDPTQHAFLNSWVGKTFFETFDLEFIVMLNVIMKHTDKSQLELSYNFILNRMSLIPTYVKITYFPRVIERMELLGCDAEMINNLKKATPILTVDIMTPHQLYHHQLDEGVRLSASDKIEDVQRAIQSFTKAMSYAGAEYLKVADLMRTAAMRIDELRITSIVTPFVPRSSPSSSSSSLSEFSTSLSSPLPMISLCDDSDTDDEAPPLITLPPREKRSKSSSSSSDKHSKKHSKKHHRSK